MKVAVGMRTQPGAYGGANQFGLTLQRYLTQRGITVVHDLQSPDIDLILITDTRPWLKSCAFAGQATLAYVKEHPATRIIFRVNECDEKRGTRLKLLNRLLEQHILLADRVVYISAWLREVFERRLPATAGKAVVIRNGADTRIFNRQGFVPWNGQGPLRLVTHHWSSNQYKGFDVYRRLDRLIGGRWRGKVSCTFIGNMPPGVHFSHITAVPPLSGPALATAIRHHHAYITASRFEPAGMHHIEGALCGLPVLYRSSGALPEYCHGFGVAFSGPDDFERALGQMRQEYATLTTRMASYQNTATRMCDQYYQLIVQTARTTPQSRRIAKTAWPTALTSQALWFKETVASLLRV